MGEPVVFIESEIITDGIYLGQEHASLSRNLAFDLRHMVLVYSLVFLFVVPGENAK